MATAKKLALIVGSTAALALGGGAAALASSGSPTPTASNDTGTPVSKAEAEKAAAQRVPSARVVESELEDEHGRTVWDVQLTKGTSQYEVVIDANSGAVLSAGPDGVNDGHNDGDNDGDGDEHGQPGTGSRDDDDATSGATPPSGTAPSAPTTRLDRNAAERLALLKVPSARTTEVELEHDDGRTTWKVELDKRGTEYKVEIDANSGTVLSVTTENHDESHSSSDDRPDTDHDD